MATLLCPNADQLAAFQAGKLRHDDLDHIAEHLATCVSCQTVLQSDSAVSDNLMRELKQAQASDVFTDESGCHRAVAQVEALANDKATHTRDDTAEYLHGAPLKALGKYQLLQRIGHGGMGEVYKATHTVLKKTVAVKVLLSGRLKDADSVARFRREIEAAGRLDHPHIVRASDADQADGHHFLVMEWLDGQDLAKWVREKGPLPVQQACDFIRQAALGLECAHEHGLVHRDVKPSNLMVTTMAGHSVVKVLDLGLALLHGNVAAEAGLTSAGQVMGTYDFIAPEQAMESHTVDARADMYSLGCTFYFLLTGQTPFHGKSEAKKLLAHQLETPTPLSQYRNDVPRDVAAIVTKMMAKDPKRRFATMGELAETLGRPKPPASKRKPILIGALCLLGLLFIAGLIHITTPDGDFVIDTDDPDFSFQVSKGTVTLTDSKTKRKYALKVLRSDKGTFDLDVSDLEADLSFRTKEFTIKRGERFALKVWFEPKQPKVVRGPPVEDPPVKEVTPKTVKEVTPKTVKELTPKTVNEITPKAMTTSLGKADHTEGVTHLSVSHDGRKMLAYTSDKLLWFWELDAESNQFKFGWKQKVDLLLSMALTPSGSQALFAAGASSNLSLVDIQTEKISIRPRGKSFEGRVVQFSADGRRYLFGENTGLSGAFSLCAWPDGEFLRKFEGHTKPVRQLCFSSDGDRILSAGDDQTVRLWDSTNGDELMKLSRVAFAKKMVVALSPDGKQALISQDNDLRLLDLKTEKVLHELKAHKDQVTAVAFGPDGRWAVSASRDKTLRVWDLVTGEVLAKLEGHTDDVTCLAVTAAGRRIVSGSRDKTLRVWDLNAPPIVKLKDEPPPKDKTPVGEIRRYLGHKDRVWFATFSPDGKSFLSGSSGELWLWDVDKTTERSRFPNTFSHVQCGVFSHDGQRVIGSPNRDSVVVWEAKPGEKIRELARFPTPVNGAECVLVSPDRPHVFYSGGSGGRIYDLDKKEELPLRFLGNRASLSKNGRRLLSCDGKTLYLWDMDTGKELSNVELNFFISPLALAPDGRHALAAAGDKQVYQWDMEEKKELKRLDGPSRVLAIAISPDGKRALTGGVDKKVRLWDLQTGTELYCFDGHTGPVLSVAFAPNGRQALSGSEDKTVRLWQLPVEQFQGNDDPPKKELKDKDSVALEILTKLGVKIDVEVRDIRITDSARFLSDVLFSRLDTEQFRKTGLGLTGLGRICLDQGNGLVVLIPVRQIKTMEAEGQQHLVTLTDGSIQKGKLLTNVRGKDDKIYQLADATSIRVLNADAAKPREPQAAKTLLTVPKAAGPAIRLSAYHIQSSRYRFGQIVKMKVDGETLDPDLTDFDKVVVTGADPDWRIVVTTAKGKETSGQWDTLGYGNSRRWWLIGETPDGWLCVISNSLGSKGFSLEKIKDEAPPKAKIEVGEIRRYIGHGQEVRFATLSPDGLSFLSGSFGEVWLWDLDSKIERQRFAGIQGWAHGGAFSHDGKRVIAGGQGGVVILWDAKTGKKLHDVVSFRVGGPAENVISSPDRPHVFYSDRGGVKLYDLDKKQELQRFQGDRLSLSKNGRRLLSGENKTLYLHDVDTGNEISHVELPSQINCLALAPDGRHAVVSVGTSIFVWDMEAKQQRKRMEGPKGRLQSVAISPDGKRALSGSYDKKVQLWDLDAGKELYCFEGHSGPVLSVAFTFDGRQALSTSGDKSIRLWQLP